VHSEDDGAFWYTATPPHSIVYHRNYLLSLCLIWNRKARRAAGALRPVKYLMGIGTKFTMSSLWTFLRKHISKEVIAKLSNSLTKTDVLRMERHCPEYLSDEQKVVLDRARVEHQIYKNSINLINIPVTSLTSLLNLGRTTPTSRQRVKEKIDGVRAYSRLDLVVIQFMEVMTINGIDVSRISHDKSLKTSLNGNASKTILIKNIRRNEVQASDKQNIEQFKYQVAYYSSRLRKLNMAIWDLTYFLNLGAMKKSDYNKICDKLQGIRPYSVLDLVIERLVDVALEHGLHPYYITYNSDGKIIEPKIYPSCL